MLVSPTPAAALVLLLCSCSPSTGHVRQSGPPPTEFERQIAGTTAQSRSLKNLAHDLEFRIRLLQDLLGTWNPSDSDGSSTHISASRNDDAQIARDLTRIECELDELESQLTGIQRLAIRLDEFERPDLQACARALDGLREEVRVKWREIVGQASTSAVR